MRCPNCGNELKFKQSYAFKKFPLVMECDKCKTILNISKEKNKYEFLWAILGVILSITASKLLVFEKYVIFLFITILIAIILDFYIRKSMWENDKYLIRPLK
ncbi:hypothetical protein J7L48_09235 [bacterium]|nr:hypothetical protein [bacterium]